MSDKSTNETEIPGQPPCANCGGPCRYDTVLPSQTWNAVVRDAALPEFLCASCILRIFARAGVSFNAELIGPDLDFVPVAVHFRSRAAKSSQRIVQENTELRWRLREAETACKRYRDRLEALLGPDWKEVE